MRPLVLTIKEWAKSADINEARFSTLSSYCLTLMVIHFLQVGLAEPVVPNLHDLHPQIFHPESDIFDLPFTCDIEPNYQSKNKMSLGKIHFKIMLTTALAKNTLMWTSKFKIRNILINLHFRNLPFSVGELLLEFFGYYNNQFDFAKDVGSIRTGKRLDVQTCQEYAKKNKTSPGQWTAYILMEEPFDRSNAGRAVVKREKFDAILKTFFIAYKSLKKGDGLKNLIKTHKS